MSLVEGFWAEAGAVMAAALMIKVAARRAISRADAGFIGGPPSAFRGSGLSFARNPIRLKLNRV
jgi:hypothetical protein